MLDTRDDAIVAVVFALARHVPYRWPFGIRCRVCVASPYPCGVVRLANAYLMHQGLIDNPVRMPIVEPPNRQWSGGR